MNDIFQRTQLLVGPEAMGRLAKSRVIVFGVGGVGSWCAESLVRSGIRQLTIVDADCVAESNINRQLLATTQSVGQPKVEVMRQRLLTINPHAEITALQQVFTETTAQQFPLQDYDYVIDAIDSLRDKALLIRQACQSGARLFSSMGAALKMDPTRIRVAEFWKVQGDPLARALRNLFKRQRQFPSRKFQCIYSDELLQNKGTAIDPAAEANPFHKAQINGTVSHVTAIFGLMLAGLVVQDITKD